MADKQIMALLKQMLGQMSPSQKKKLQGIVSNEESLRSALSSIDSKKAQKIVKNLNLDGDAEQIVNAIKENPDLIHKADKNLF